MFRAAIEKMTGYTPGEQPRPGERLIKLNTNENPYPPSPRVRRAVVRAAADSLRLYPAPRADDFVASASKLYGVRKEMILAGNGSDELLAMIFRATLGPRDTVAYPVPTYSLYDTLASIQEARVLRFPVEHDFSIPLDKLAKARAKLTIVCNPNSPSGILTPAAKLGKLARFTRSSACDRRSLCGLRRRECDRPPAALSQCRDPSHTVEIVLARGNAARPVFRGRGSHRRADESEGFVQPEPGRTGRGCRGAERRVLDAAQRGTREAYARGRHCALAQDGLRGSG